MDTLPLPFTRAVYVRHADAVLEQPGDELLPRRSDPAWRLDELQHLVEFRQPQCELERPRHAAINTIS